MTEATTGTFWNALILLGYALPAVLLILKLMVAIWRLRGLDQRARHVSEPGLRALAEPLRQDAGIGRPVALKYSDEIDSPVSYGLITPVLLLPGQALLWPKPTLKDLLYHEFGHIGRLDWITGLFARTVASIYWLNPLVWVALKGLKDEAEHSCDDVVLYSGQSTTGYAENLVRIARHCRRCRSQRLPVQALLNPQTLAQRIDYILEDKTMKTVTNGNYAGSALLASAIIVIGLTNAHFVSAQERQGDQDLMPLEQPAPVYPEAAADAGVEGWVQLAFTIDEQGLVVRDSVAVADAEPPAVFDESAAQALKQFTFRPRIRDGQPQAVPGVNYVFRFELNDSAAADNDG